MVLFCVRVWLFISRNSLHSKLKSSYWCSLMCVGVRVCVCLCTLPACVSFLENSLCYIYTGNRQVIYSVWPCLFMHEEHSGGSDVLCSNTHCSKLIKENEDDHMCWQDVLSPTSEGCWGYFYTTSLWFVLPDKASTALHLQSKRRRRMHGCKVTKIRKERLN